MGRRWHLKINHRVHGGLHTRAELVEVKGAKKTSLLVKRKREKKYSSKKNLVCQVDGGRRWHKKLTAEIHRGLHTRAALRRACRSELVEVKGAKKNSPLVKREIKKV